MSSGALWVARHPPVVAENLCYGRTDVPTRISHEHAASLLADSFLPGHAATAWPEIVWTSPVSRCRGVAEHLAKRVGAELRVDDALYEMDFGVWDGRTWADIEATDGDAYLRWLHEWEHVAPPGGEAPRDLEQRVRTWTESLEPQRCHALVAHAGVVRALHVVLAARSWPEAMEIRVEHLAWSRLAWPPSLDSESACGPACAPLTS